MFRFSGIKNRIPRHGQVGVGGGHLQTTCSETQATHCYQTTPHVYKAWLILETMDIAIIYNKKYFTSERVAFMLIIFWDVLDSAQQLVALVACSTGSRKSLWIVILSNIECSKPSRC